MKRSNVARVPVLLLLAAVVLASAPRSARACSCRYAEPCATFWRADAVFLGRVVETSERIVEWDLGEGKAKYAQQVATFEVEEAFRGVEGSRVEITGGFEQIFEDSRTLNSCSTFFAVGEQHIVYATRNAAYGFLEANKCLRSRSATSGASIAPDVEYGRRAARGETAPGVYGNLLGVPPPENGDDVGLAGVTVKIEGGGRSYECVTGRYGAFHKEGIAPGTYTVRPVLDEAWRVSGSDPSGPIEVPERGCVRVEMYATRFGSVRGSVVDYRGAPAGAITVRLLPAASSDRSDRSGSAFPSATTAADGTYLLEGIPPGNYNVVVSPDGLPLTPHEEFSYPTAFYSKAANGRATTVTLGEGERVAIGSLKLARRVPVVELAVDVLHPDGDPVTAGMVELAFARDGATAPVTGYRTEAGGRAVLRLHSGVAYTLRARSFQRKPRIYSRKITFVAGRGPKRVTLRLRESLVEPARPKAARSGRNVPLRRRL